MRLIRLPRTLERVGTGGAKCAQPGTMTPMASVGCRGRFLRGSDTAAILEKARGLTIDGGWADLGWRLGPRGRRWALVVRSEW